MKTPSASWLSLIVFTLVAGCGDKSAANGSASAAPEKKKVTKQQMTDIYMGTSKIELAKVEQWARDQLGAPHKLDGDTANYWTSPPEPCQVMHVRPKSVSFEPAPDPSARRTPRSRACAAM